MKSLTTEKMRAGFSRLDQLLPRPVSLIIGGGGAMLLAYDFPLATADIDAVPKGLPFEEISPFVDQVARELSLPGDWLNPWFTTFTHVLPTDYASRLVEVFSGKHLRVEALGREDLLLMKCFAHRKKDIPHARALLRSGADSEKVFDRIDELKKKKIPGSDLAANFLEEIIEMENP